MNFYNVFLDVVCTMHWPQYFPWGLLTCPFLGNLFARKVLYYEYLDFVANQFHYYFDLVMPQGKYYISLPKLITLVTFWHVMKTRSCQVYLSTNKSRPTPGPPHSTTAGFIDLNTEVIGPQATGFRVFWVRLETHGNSKANYSN